MKQHKPNLQKKKALLKHMRFLALALSMMLLLSCFSACKDEKQSSKGDVDDKSNAQVEKPIDNSNQGSANNGNSSEQEEPIDNPDQSGADNWLKVEYLYNEDYIYDGNAEIRFKDNGKEYSGIINAKGEVIYYAEGDVYIDWVSIGNGAGFVTTNTDDNKKTYTVFNEKGEKALTESGNVFDEIIGYGDGLLLVYKNTSTIAKEEHSYGVLDCNGKWIKSLTAGPELPKADPYYHRFYDYIGDGVFIYEEKLYSYDYTIYNSNTNKAYSITDSRIYSDCFYNGVIYCALAYYGGYICNYGDYESKSELPLYFALHADGTFEELSEFKFACDDLLINTNGEYMRIFNKTNNTEKVYTDFPAERIAFVQFDGDFGVIILNGADGKTYFTVVDKEFNQKVAPTLCANRSLGYFVSISEGRIVYKNTSDVYKVIDVNGNTIVSEAQGFTYISEYRGGIASAKTNYELWAYCLDLDGKPLTTVKFKGKTIK